MTLKTRQGIQAAYDRDQLRAGDKVYDSTILPVNFETITDQWLTGALCSEVAGATVTAHRLLPVVEGTTNRRVIELEYNAAGR